jgi:chromosome segregation ATPase
MSEERHRTGGTDQDAPPKRETKGAQSDLLDELLPERWQEVLDLEIQLLELQGSLEADLIKKSIAGHTTLLNLQDQAQAANGLEQYPQAQIDEAEEQLKEQQGYWKADKERLQQEKKAIDEQIAEQETEVSAAFASLQNALNQLKALPQEVQKARQEFDALDQEWRDAQGPMKAAKAHRRNAAHEWYEVVKGDRYRADLEAAVEQGFGDLEQAHKGKAALVVGDGSGKSLQDVQIEIKVVDKKLSYLQKHWDRLKLALLRQGT